MKSAKDIEQSIKQLTVESSDQIHNRILNKLLIALDKSKTQTTVEPTNIWRTIMRSRVTQIAAAAVIIIAILTATHFWGNPMESMTWADVVQPILTARTVIFNVVMSEAEDAPVMKAMNMGTQRVRTELLSPDGKTVQVIAIIDYNALRMLQLIPEKKTAIFTDLKDLPEKPKNILKEMRNIITDLQNDPDVSVEALGEKEMDGRVAKGFRATGPDGEVTVWADSKTTLPIRMEQTWRQMQFVCTNFQFDAEMDESLFSMEIPEGYSEPVQGELSIEGSNDEDLVTTLRIWAEVILDDVFPRDFTGQAYLEDVKANRQKFVNLQDKEKIEMAMKMQPGFIFVQLLKSENDWHYVGKNVKLGDAESPVCWYRPDDSKTYRVICGDLSVKDVAPEDLPK
jgi:hypothetical protein